MELTDLMQLVQGGGSLALCACAVVIFRATQALIILSERLARIEKALDKYMSERP